MMGSQAPLGQMCEEGWWLAECGKMHAQWRIPKACSETPGVNDYA